MSATTGSTRDGHFAKELRELAARITVEQDDGYRVLQVDGDDITGVSEGANNTAYAALRRFGELCEVIAGTRKVPPIVPFNEQSQIILRPDGKGDVHITTWGEFKKANADGMAWKDLVDIEYVIRMPGAWYLMGGGAEPITFIARYSGNPVPAQRETTVEPAS